MVSEKSGKKSKKGINKKKSSKTTKNEDIENLASRILSFEKTEKSIQTLEDELRPFSRGQIGKLLGVPRKHWAGHEFYGALNHTKKFFDLVMESDVYRDIFRLNLIQVTCAVDII